MDYRKKWRKISRKWILEEFDAITKELKNNNYEDNFKSALDYGKKNTQAS